MNMQYTSKAAQAAVFRSTSLPCWHGKEECASLGPGDEHSDSGGEKIGDNI